MDENTIFDKVHDIDLKKTMENSYIDYAMSVIVARALPDVRDGLKPVQRRVLYSMIELNNGPDKPHRKCARIVGDTMGKYHPHGDSSIYETLVVMSQNFKKGMALVDGHGNFGSIEGDGAAAMRYTEARLEKFAEEVYLKDLDKTVNFVPNYDETEKEPEVLPVRVPNLLINGAEGIAVGMSTSIPPHNLGEVIDAVQAYIDNPEVTTQELMEFMPGPDFPTGGIIMGHAGIRAAYATGRGRVIVRAKTEIEEHNNRFRIVISEIPYQVNKLNLVKSIIELADEKRVEGIHDVVDHSSREGMRVVIDLKKDANPQVVLNRLFAQTQLQTTFAINMLALVEVNGKLQPRILSLRHILDEYIAYQEQVLIRRTRFDLKKAQERAHLLEGLLIAEDNIDAVIKTIRDDQLAHNIENAKAYVEMGRQHAAL